jgi:hypothetical protein
VIIIQPDSLQDKTSDGEALSGSLLLLLLSWFVGTCGRLFPCTGPFISNRRINNKDPLIMVALYLTHLADSKL